MIINNGPIGSGKFNPEEDLLIKFSLNDEYENIKFYENETDQHKEYYELRPQNGTDTSKWYIKFLNDCYITFKKPLKCELFMVGKGSDGGQGSGSRNYNTNNGGNGGNGGKILKLDNVELRKISNIKITILAINTSFLSYSSSNGNYIESLQKGGNGATYTAVSNAGENGIKKYGIYYGAGGGGGGMSCFDNTTSSGTTIRAPSEGGGYNSLLTEYSGGEGGTHSNDDDDATAMAAIVGKPGLPNTGSGGGGGCGSYRGKGTGTSGKGGAGSYGTIIISNY